MNTIHVERYIDDDECNPETYGRETGTDYIIEVGGHKTYIHFPDELPRPDIQIQVMLGDEVFDVDKLPWAVPALAALVADPRVQAELLRYLSRQGEPIHTRADIPVPPSAFNQSLRQIIDALPGLGSREVQAGLLKTLAVSVNGSDAAYDELHALLTAKLAEKRGKRPERQPYPQPEGFQERRIIGQVAGEDVIGHAGWDKWDGVEVRYNTTVTLNGLGLNCDGDLLSIDEYYSEGIAPADLARLVELWQGSTLQEYIALAQRWCDELREQNDRLVEQRKAA